MASTTETVVAAELLNLLRCPATMQRVRMATSDEIQRINQTNSRDDAPVHVSEIVQALVREDGSVAYPIRDGVPVLLPGAAIAL